MKKVVHKKISVSKVVQQTDHQKLSFSQRLKIGASCSLTRAQTIEKGHKKWATPAINRGDPWIVRRYAISIDDVLMWWSRGELNPLF